MAKPTAKRVPKRDETSKKAFGAATAIFVPPELQHEQGPKRVPPKVSVVVKPQKPREETTAERKARLKRETNARERLRLGRKIHTATGANRLDAVPDYHPPPSRRISLAHGLISVPRFIPGTDVQFSDAARTAGQIGQGVASGLRPITSLLIPNPAGLNPRHGGDLRTPGDLKRKYADAARTAAAVPKALAHELEPFASILTPNPAGLDPRRGGDIRTAGDVKKKYEAASDVVIGKALTNLIFHADLANTKGEAAGTAIGVLGVLPFGRIAQIARLGKEASVIGKIGEALPDTPERDAWRAALSQRLGEEKANDAILLTDSIARNLHPEDPNLFYKTQVHASNYADFAKTPEAKGARYQTEAGPRMGLVEGQTGERDIPLNPKAAFKAANAGHSVIFTTYEGDTALITKEGDSFKLQVFKLIDPEGSPPREYDLTMDEARQAIKDGTDAFRTEDVVETGTPVFTPDLPAQVEKLPDRGLSKAETTNRLKNAVKPAEWENSGMEAFVESYPDGARIPKADIQRHLASPLNAYDLDEFILRSDSADFASRWHSYNNGGVVVRDPTDAEPYIEIVMHLRTPLRTRIARGVFGERAVPAPYQGKGHGHWDTNDVVGHVRMHLITDADGKRALVIDEVQSDWASEWRKVQSFGGREGIKNRIEEASNRVGELEYELYGGGPEPLSMAEKADVEAEIRTLEGEIQDMEDLLDEVPGPPPLGTKQMQAIVRRSLRFAEESGVDRVIIVQGDVQAVRNNAFRKTPRGRSIDLHSDHPDLRQHVKAWYEDTRGMTAAEVKAFANHPSHDEAPMVKTFKRLYGSGDEGGTVTSLYEKEMGEKGGVRKGIFEGGYSDEAGAIRRSAEHQWGPFEGQVLEQNLTRSNAEVGDVVWSEGEFGRVVGENEAGEMMIRHEDGSYSPLAEYYQLLQPVHVQGTMPMDGYVIEMTEGAKAKARAPMAYYQQRAWEKIPKGATAFFADGTRAIHLFEDADISTVIHELSHVVLPDLNEVDRAILNRHFNNFATTADHEAYARALERYVYEGQAMSSALDGVLGRIKDWMGQVYLHVNNIGAHVHPEVKQVFDRMLIKPETPAEQLARMLKEAPKLRKAQKAIYSEERSQRISDLFDQWDEAGDVENFHTAMGALRGELEKVPFTGLDELTPEALTSLVRSIRASDKVKRYEKVRAAQAVIQAKEGKLPTDSELRLLNKIFGGEASFKKSKMGTLERIFVELWNFPRSVAASFDLSAPLRQGLVAGTRHPIVFAKAFRPMFQALRSDERAAQIAEEIANRANANLYERAGLAIDTAAGNVDLAKREEQFYSSWAEKVIPPVKWSGRSYEAFLHRLRADIFDLTLESARAAGRDVESDEFIEGLGRMVNQMTGRGVLPDAHLLPVETAAPLLNTFLFSPRLLASRVNMISPVYYAKLWKSDPYLFAEATKNLLSTTMATVTVLVTASQIPGVTVGLDPTSANFGKIRIGDTRIDIMAGFGPLLVFLTREVMGKSTSSSTGKSQDLKGGYGKSSRLDVLYRFVESKAAPTTVIGFDLLRGQTYIGEPVTLKGEAINSTAPMMLRDVVDAWRSPKDPMTAFVAAAGALALGTFGIGISTYPNRVPSSPGKAPAFGDPFGGGSSQTGVDPFETPSQGEVPTGADGMPVGW